MKNIIFILIFLFPLFLSAQEKDTIYPLAGQKIIRDIPNSTYVIPAEVDLMVSGNQQYIPVIADTIFNLHPDSTLASITTSFTRPTGKFAYIGLPRGYKKSGTITVPDSTIYGNSSEYGDGDAFQFIGTDTVSGTWALYDGNIWSITYSTVFNSLFLDGVKVPVSRHPNSVRAKISEVITTKIFTADSLNNGVAWTGATAIIRPVGWSYYARTVVSSNEDTIEISSETYSLGALDQLYIINKLETLDGANQWAWDSSTNTLYLWTPEGDSPNLHTVEVSSIDNAFIVNGKSNVRIRGLNFFGYEADAIKIINSDNIEIKNNEFSHNYASGIEMYDEDNSYIDITYNSFASSMGWGIKALGANHTIDRNTFADIGLDENIGIDGTIDPLHSATAVLGYPTDSTTIANNTIINTGFTGILFYGLDNIIEKNRIDTACTVLNDGGGIYTHLTSTGSVIRKNIISNVGIVGKGYDMGIYMDATTNGVSIVDNTTIQIWGTGIFLSTCKNTTTTGNTVFDSGGENGTQLTVRHITEGWTMENNLIEDNILFGKESFSQMPIKYWTSAYVTDLAQINANVLGTPGIWRSYYYINEPTQASDSISEFITRTGKGIGATNPVVPDYEKTEIFYNASDVAVTQDLSGHTNWTDLLGVAVTELILQPWTSKILNYSD